MYKMPAYTKSNVSKRPPYQKYTPKYTPKAQTYKPRTYKAKPKYTAPSGMSSAGALGGSIGRSIGEGAYSLGSKFADLVRGKIQSMIGSGDYQIGDMPQQNTLTARSAVQIPKFLSGKNSLMITHREYLGDVYSSPIGTPTGSFHIQSFRVNPGLSQSFPWLSTVANSFEQYKLLGLVYEFKSTSSDFNATGQALGTVVLATEYDVLDSTPSGHPFSSKQQMEASEFAVSCKSSENMMHGVECARSQSVLGERYVRAAGQPISGDARFYDACTVAIATQGVSANGVNLGELWVTYNVAFLKPVVEALLSTALATRMQLVPASVSVATPVPLAGATVVFDNIGIFAATGGPGFTLSASAHSMSVGTVFEVIVIYTGTPTATVTPPIVVGSTGLELINSYANNGGPQIACPFPSSGTGATASTVCIQGTFRYTGGPSGAGWSIVFSTSGYILPAAISAVDLRINQLNSNAY